MNDIQVLHLFDVIGMIRPLERPWMLDTGEIESLVKSWCESNGAAYYAADSDTFATCEAKALAREKGLGKVVVAELIDGVQ